MRNQNDANKSIFVCFNVLCFVSFALISPALLFILFLKTNQS